MKITKHENELYIVTESENVRILLRPSLLDVIEDVKKLTVEQLDMVIQNEGLPIAPDVDQKAQLWLTMSIVQNSWYAHTAGQVPPGVLNGHKARVEKYEKALTSIKVKPATPKAAVNVKPKSPKTPNTPGRTPVHRVSDRRYAINPDHDALATDGLVQFGRWIYETLVAAGPKARLNINETVLLAKERGVIFRGADGGISQAKFQLNRLAELGIAIYFPFQMEISPGQAPAPAFESDGPSPIPEEGDLA